MNRPHPHLRVLMLALMLALLAPARSAIAQVGACCNNTTAACQLLTSSQCFQSGGTFVSGSSCSPNNPCPALVGACCDTGTGACQSRLAAGCTGGQFFGGAGSSCTANPCLGSCCHASQGTQCQLTSNSACTGADAIFGNIGTSCSPNPCAGACCANTTGSCTISTHILCGNVAGGGSFQGYLSVCSPDPCIGVSGGCCTFPSGACAHVVGSGNCNGAYLGNGTSCSPDQCAARFGACCLADGTCRIADLQGCGALGGDVFRGVGSGCSPNFCIGACCNNTTIACTVTSPSMCTQGNGTFAGSGASCAPDPCPGMAGACCHAMGTTCALTFPSNCDAGSFVPHTACSPSPCAALTGACCANNSSTCTVSLRVECEGLFVTFAGAGSSCSPGACVGACCRDTNQYPGVSCSLTAGQQNCMSDEGFYHGNGSTCSPCSPCALPGFGACCRSTACSIECVGSCTGAFTRGVLACSPDPCAALVGACCLNGVSSCTLTTAPECTGPNRVFSGAGTPCGSGACVGACCISTSSGTGCILRAGHDICTSDDGSYRGNGTTCSPCNACTSAGLVACCHGAACTIECAPSCTGSFNGAVHTCTATTCCPADFNHMNGVDIADIFAFLSAWFAHNASADFNHDGQVGVTDIFAFLGAWFAGCH